MPRKISRKGLIRKLDRVFSLYIRTRNAKNEIVECVTCGVKKHYTEMDAGHFVSRRHYATRWTPSNCHVQCKKCNNWGAGESYLMGKYIDKAYGAGTADELITLSRQIKKFTDEDLKELIEKYS
jgi:5-methylcytosine-specific restriction endonuclease McrA